MKTLLLLVVTAGAFAVFGCADKDKASGKGTDGAKADPRLAGFTGKLDPSYEKSVEDWPKSQKFTGKEPNVIIFLLDYVGYSQLGAFVGLCRTLHRLHLEGDPHDS